MKKGFFKTMGRDWMEFNGQITNPLLDEVDFIGQNVGPTQFLAEYVEHLQSEQIGSVKFHVLIEEPKADLTVLFLEEPLGGNAGIDDKPPHRSRSSRSRSTLSVACGLFRLSRILSTISRADCMSSLALFSRMLFASFWTVRPETRARLSKTSMTVWSRFLTVICAMMDLLGTFDLHHNGSKAAVFVKTGEDRVVSHFAGVSLKNSPLPSQGQALKGLTTKSASL